MNGVVVAAAVASPRDVAGFRQVVNDPVGGAFGDPDPVANLSQADGRILRDAEQDERVIGQERPRGGDGGHLSRIPFLDIDFVYSW